MKRKRMNRDLLINEPIDRTAFAIIMVALGALMVLMVKYRGDSEYPTVSSDSLKLIIIGTMALGSLIIFKMAYGQPHLIENKMGKIDPLDYVFASLSYIGIQVMIMFLRSMRIFQVSAVDVWAFYVSAAVIEELTYRLALITIIEYLLYRYFSLKPKAARPILIMISGLVFALVHIRYLSDPFLTLLTFMGGCSQAYWLLRTKSILPCILAHSIINFMAAGSLIQQLK